ncbi:Maternal protein tudor [Pseudolycoriella hygida]|uniref:Maternal protein tudor n=1 Tax=Pseudolycoriella hygida TaxID=35572 RepID=A0A9Q0N2G1_9DIPT|nr:Maternal protein tudor [Pseudolycoriella hygida]
MGFKIRSEAIDWGLKNEEAALREYSKKVGENFIKCGIFVDSSLNYLAATPDGINESKSVIVEIKCPYSIRFQEPESASFLKDFLLKKNHAYYTQVQIQMHVTKVYTCDFVVWTTKGILIQPISYDKRDIKLRANEYSSVFYVETKEENSEDIEDELCIIWKKYCYLVGIKTLTEDDYKSFETFARTKMKKFVPDNANLQDYFHIFADDPELFEILPGHIRLLNEIVRHSTAVDTTFYDSDEEATEGILSNGSQEGSSFHKTDVVCKEKCNKSSTNQNTRSIKTETFKALILGGSPHQFYVRLERNCKKMTEICATLELARTWPILEKIEVGQLCAAAFNEKFHRAKILSIAYNDTGATVHFIDNGHQYFTKNMRKLPQHLQKVQPLAICCSLESRNGTFTPELIKRFANLSKNETYDFKLISNSSYPAIVHLFENGIQFREMDQLKIEETSHVVEIHSENECISTIKTEELDVNQYNKEFDEIIKRMSMLVEQHERMGSKFFKFLEPTSLSDDDSVIICYIETPKSFWVQQTKTVAEYNAMMDVLRRYCKTAPMLTKPQIGMACAAYYEKDQEWYRCEIIEIHMNNVLTRFVDFGIEITTDMHNLKEINEESLMIPKQALRCCLIGFETTQNVAPTSSDRMEFLAETSIGERRHFRVKLHGHVDDCILLNLIDDSEVPALNVSTRMLQLSLPQNEFQKLMQKKVNEVEAIVTTSTDSIRVISDDSTCDNKSIHRVIPDEPLESYCDSTNDIFDEKSMCIEQVEVSNANEVLQPIAEPEGLCTEAQLLTHNDNQIVDHAATNSTKAKAFISHFVRPDRFYLHISEKFASLLELQETIQVVASQLLPLEDFSNETLCIALYTCDNQWYRAVIIDSDENTTTILFIDYGNTDSITDRSLIKSMSDAFDKIPPYAIPCALPLEAKDCIEWSDESCDLFKNLMKIDEEVEFEFVCKGKSNNFVKLYQGDVDFTEELTRNGHAIRLDSIISGSKCYVSHINSISDFYIQMKSDTNALEKLADYLLDESKFAIMTDVKEGVLCSAKYLDDGLWYRGKIKSHKEDGTEVCFIDYGNSSITNEIRILPTEIANIPALAKYCSLIKPKDVQYWSKSAEKRFVELANNGGVFMVDVISPGKKSIVDLISNDKSILEEISQLCDKDKLLEINLQMTADDFFTPEKFKAFIVGGSPKEFYIQLESDLKVLDRLWEDMQNAFEWPILEKVEVGDECAALFDGNYYRAKVLAVQPNNDAIVHYIDYGNQSASSDLRELPFSLKYHRQLAIFCCLDSKHKTYSVDLMERFEKLSRESPYEFAFSRACLLYLTVIARFKSQEHHTICCKNYGSDLQMSQLFLNYK